LVHDGAARVNSAAASGRSGGQFDRLNPKKAQANIDGRPYKAIEDMMKVKGIKQGIFGKIKDYTTVD
jgi:DNA uptake protein ComE-like DNA-binding protein